MNLPNRITIARILLVPAFITAAVYWADGVEYCKDIALFLFLLACFSDALDGLIARRWNQKTRLGALLDPLADKLLLVSAYLVLSLMQGIPADSRIPVWLTILVISRDALLVFGTLIIFVLYQKIEFEARVIGKITTVLQMLFIVLVMSPVSDKTTMIFAEITAVFTVISGIFYIRNGIRRLAPEI